MTTTIASLKADIERLRNQVDALSRFGSDDDYSDGAVLRYDRWGFLVGGGERRLTYVAIKAGGKWWISNASNRPYTWDELTSLMADSQCVAKVTSWNVIR